MNTAAVDRGRALHGTATTLLLLLSLACGTQQEDRSAAMVPDSAIANDTLLASGTDEGASNTGESANDDDGAVDPDRLIRTDGIAHAAAGMTIGELRAALPQGTTLGPASAYMVDIDAMPVVQNGDTLYLVLIPAGEPTGNSARISLLATTNTTFRTVENVGPGTSLGDAAAAYGPPTIAYNINDESREYATFPDLPPTVRMRVQPGSDNAAFAGIYTTAGEYNETSRYDPAARITMVIVLAR